MVRPDFAHTSLARLEDRDIRFLLDNFPGAGEDQRNALEVIKRMPTTLESMLDSDYVFKSMTRDHALLLDVSPFLMFNVLLRRSADIDRSSLSRSVINYIANLLSLFAHIDRARRIQRHDSDSVEYIVDMISQAQGARPERQFVIHAHIGNYSLYMTGMYAKYLRYRHRYKRRAIDINYYLDQGQAYYSQASQHSLAPEYGLREVFAQLSGMFDFYRHALNHMSNHYLITGQA